MKDKIENGTLVEIDDLSISKFKIGQQCFCCLGYDFEIIKITIEKIIISLSKNEEENSIYYSVTDVYGYALILPQEQIFDTQAEAEQKLKELKGEKV